MFWEIVEVIELSVGKGFVGVVLVLLLSNEPSMSARACHLGRSDVVLEWSAGFHCVVNALNLSE